MNTLFVSSLTKTESIYRILARVTLRTMKILRTSEHSLRHGAESAAQCNYVTAREAQLLVAITPSSLA